MGYKVITFSDLVVIWCKKRMKPADMLTLRDKITIKTGQ